MDGRLIAMRARPVSSIENQTAWVSVTGDLLRQRFRVLLREHPLCISIADLPIAAIKC